MKKAEMGMQTKPKKGKMISESGDLADALNEFNEMKKKGTGPKNNKEAVKYMDDLNTKGKLGTPGIKPKMKMGGAMAKQAAVAVAMKKAGKTPKKKMQYGGEAASMKPTSMMKKGGMMKKCAYGCK